MATSPSPAAGGRYWQLSRAPRYSILFVLPLLASYEVLALAINGGTGGLRNGADVILKGLFASFLGPRGPLVFSVLLVLTLIALVVRDQRRNPGTLRPQIFVVMLVESVVLALAFGIVVGIVAAELVSSLHLAIGPVESVSRGSALVISLGAGLYEELLFRVILVGLLLWAGKHVLGLGPVAAGTIAVLGGALVFSAFHYIGPYGDRFETSSFVFRAVAGLAFSGLYVTRGFGITAWTHALYDVFLLISRGT